MGIFLGELVGTMILILLGLGVVANVSLKKTYGNNAGLIAITLAWAIAVFVGVFIASSSSGAHLNPAVTFALAYLGKIEMNQLFLYLGGQFIGAFLGAVLTWIMYKPHFDETEDSDAKLGVFCTSPAIKNTLFNFLSEVIGTFALVFGVLFITGPANSLGALDALPVALLVLGIGLSLGGTTGYAINPARDFAPRFAHFILPIKGKRDSNWSYSWIPLIAPIVGALLAAIIYEILL